MERQQTQSSVVIRFGVFEADLRAAELRKAGRRLTLQQQPFAILAALLERPGELVTREDLCARLWPDGVVVDYDQSINKAVNKLRDALGDSAESPRFVETLPRRGYRFIAPVTGDAQAPGGAADESRARARTAEGAPPAAEPSFPNGHASALADVPPEGPPPVERLAEHASRQGIRAPGRLVAAAGALVLVGLAVGAYAWWSRGAEPRSTTASARKVMLAILPFQNMSGQVDQDYFSDGLTEELIAQLGRLRPERLGVIARTSAMHYKDTPKRIDEIGRELGVDYVVEGSVRRDADKVRITAQLIQVSDQTHLWADVYERGVADVFTIQSDVSRRVARSLELELLPRGEAALTDPPTSSAEAWDEYLRGRFHWSRRTVDGLLKSRDHFARATALDPAYALGFVGLADAWNLMADYGMIRPREAFPQAKVAVQRALQIDAQMAEAHATLGWIQLVYDRDIAAAEQSLRRAIALNPGYASAHQWYAYALKVQGRHDEALARALEARTLDPMSLMMNAIIGWHHYLARDYARAIERCRAVIDVESGFWRVHSYLGWSYLRVGRHAEALAELRAASALFGGGPARDAELAHGLAVAGRRDEARAILDALTSAPPDRYVEAYLVARIEAALGDHDDAFAWLDRARDEHAVKLILAGIDPELDPLRGDPRFGALLTRIGLR